MKIYAPVKDFNGWRNNVQFVNGVGEADDSQDVKWFETRGYTVEYGVDFEQVEYETCEELEPIEEETVELMGYSDKSPNFEEMTPIELRDWARANGFGNKIKNTRSKDKLIEILRG